MENKIKIVADDAIPFLKGVLEPFADITYENGASITNAMLQNAKALFIRTRTEANEELLKNTSVEFIATATIGTDHLDEIYLNKNHITWTNAVACNANSVLQYIIAAVFHIIQKEHLKFSEITLGIIGVGNIGSRIRDFFKMLGVKILCSDPPLKAKDKNFTDTPLQEIYKNADIITFHTPYIQAGPFKTFHLCDTSSFEMMKPSAWIINASRGAVVDNKSLESALKENKIRGAVLDVFENEPNVNQEFINLLEIATPHIAGYGLDGKSNATSIIVREFANYFHIGALNHFEICLPEIKEPLTFEFSKTDTPEKIFYEIFKQTYDIHKESEKFKQDISKFEFLRKNYPVRREPFAYRLQGKNIPESILHVLKLSGFSVL